MKWLIYITISYLLEIQKVPNLRKVKYIKKQDIDMFMMKDDLRKHF